ncbi:hypothetical protein [Pseudomonas koreensis]|uniref:Uncharacterized protein n=1 Tax=Pseudomonas koreensis TaxID=198620 RepID=A0AA94ENT8_9PSED|nr:hypothetical protein [Pseudomonas koreensis]RVD77074.1 hypothetical protein A9HBioS_3097 [Pseudomonas koreensis]
MTDYEDLQKRCQRGATNLKDANNLLAECYGVLGKLGVALAECTASLEGEVLQKYHGQKPEDMHPVTRREYDRDMAEIEGYKALSKEG